MAVSQKRSNKKPTGSRYKNCRKKRLHELGSLPTHTKLDKRKSRKVRVLGKNYKHKLLSADTVNLVDKKTKKVEKIKIKSVLENPANRHFVRRNILTKGTVIETEKGKAKITSRPGQEGTLNAVLLE